jgi:hypothetical protein
MGVGTPDIWGGDRTELKERYANSMLAINASTGKLVTGTIGLPLRRSSTKALPVFVNT